MIKDKKKLNNILELYKQHGDKAAEMLNIKPSTLERYLRYSKKEVITEEDLKEPNILILDIENSPSLAAVWGVNQQFIHTNQIVQEWYMFSWAARWLYSTEVFSDVITPEESLKRDDSRIAKSLWEFVDYADIIIGHNVNSFDIPKMNARFIKHGMNPTSSCQVIDTLKAARKHFMFTSNKLDYLCQQLNIPRKIDNGGMERWIQCMDGDAQALLDMETYNKHDIIITEDLYIKLRPYMKYHPNVGLFDKRDSDCCYKCGSIELEWLDSFYYTAVNKFSEYRCAKCGSIGRSRFSAMSKDNKSHITSPVAR